MPEIGIIRKVYTGESYRGSSGLLVDCEIDDPSNLIQCSYFFQFGEQSIPTPGTEILIHTVSSNQKIACSAETPIAIDLSTGEKRIYSTEESGKEPAATIDLKNDKTIILNESTENAARFKPTQDTIDDILTVLQALCLKNAIPTDASVLPPLSPTSFITTVDKSNTIKSEKVFL